MGRRGAWLLILALTATVVIVLVLALGLGRRRMGYGVHTIRADAESLALVKEAGADWVVQLFSWREIARWRGQYNWDYPDAVVRGAEFHGLKLAIRLDQHPAWARTAPAANGPPDDLNDYGDFVEAVARRYRGRIRAYIIWNEPNLAREWGGGRPDPAGYVEMLKVAYARAKAADPHCLVVSAGLAPTNHQDDQALDDRLYLEAMYEAGVRGYFDILGAHPYGFAYPPDDPHGAHEGLNFARLMDLRQIMVAHGDKDKPIWATEVGWTTGAGPAEVWHVVTPAQQADYLVGAFRRARREWPWLTMMAVWNLGGEFPLGDEKWGYNLLDERGVPGPAYEALRAMPKGWALPSPAVLARRLQQALGDWVRGQRCQVLAEDVTVHLGDTELPPPWMPLHQGANPSAVWTGEFYLRRPGRGDWTLHINLMQPNERGSYVAVNGHRLEPDFPVEDYSRVWVSLSLTVPADYLRLGANRLTVFAGKELPDYQQLGYTWDDLQFKGIFLSER